ncbi:hypothetical protein [Brevundimonas sp.]|uniref:hypothetical protein n=1 Tax=Brevundimonas sp. TaxID=1871086 RepID=UPI0028A0DBEA|nr:hypothetical protein [Brevundimonas sp.]
MKLSGMAFLAVLLSAGTATAQEGEGAQGGLFSEEQIAMEVRMTRSWLEESLVDYESARFRNVRVVLLSPNRRDRSQVVLAVCGQANARNRMGGYNGYKDFYFSSAMDAFRGQDFGVFASEVCGRANSLNETDYTDQLKSEGAQ